MKRLDPAIIDYYDQEIVKMIAEKYGYSQMDALRQFVFSKTHELLEDEETGMTSFGAGAVFDICDACAYDACDDERGWRQGAVCER